MENFVKVKTVFVLRQRKFQEIFKLKILLKFKALYKIMNING